MTTEPLTPDAVRALVDKTAAINGMWSKDQIYAHAQRLTLALTEQSKLRKAAQDVLGIVLEQRDAAEEELGELRSRTVGTAEEWEALPIGAIVQTAGGSVVTRYDADTGTLFGDTNGYSWHRLYGGRSDTGWKLPATILWQPLPPTPEEATDAP